MANNPITPTASSYVNGTIIDAQYMDDLASALNREVGFATQATAASTKTLVLADLSTQEFTGTTAAQVVVMPVVTTLGIGMKWVISNKSTQTIAVNSSGGNLIFTVPAATNWLFTCNAITGTTAASWSNSYAGASAAPTSAGAFSGCQATISANVSLANGTNTKISFDTNTFVTDAIHSTSTNPTRFTVPAGKAGYWLVAIQVEWQPNATGNRQIAVYKNGTGFQWNDNAPSPVGPYYTTYFTSIMSLAAGDYIEANVYQSSGGALLMGGNSGINSGTTQLNFSFLGA